MVRLLFIPYILFATLLVGIFAIDMAIYPGVTQSKLSLSPHALFFVFIAMSILLVTFFRSKLLYFGHYQSVAKLFFLILLLSSLFFCLEMFTHANFVYSTFHIYYPHLFFISAIFGFLAFFSEKKDYKISYVSFFLSLILLLSGAIIRFWPQDAFFILSKEDNLFENLQALFFGIAGILACFSARKYFVKKYVGTAIFITFLGLVLLFITGEEISWGQRIFHLTSPILMQEINTKQEITIHNIYGINQYQFLFYMALSFYLSCFWLIQFVLPKKIRQFFVTPDWYYMGFFLPIFFFYAYMNFLGGDHWEWQEYGELMLSVGIYLFLLEIYESIKISSKHQ